MRNRPQGELNQTIYDACACTLLCWLGFGILVILAIFYHAIVRA